MRYFTFEEAEQAIPALEKIFETAFDIKNRVEAKAQTVQALEERGTLDTSQLAIERSQLEFLTQCLQDILESAEDIGTVVKGLDPALVDFPYRLDGKEVYLCWKFGEKTIEYYHGIEDGFAGRKPLPKKILSH